MMWGSFLFEILLNWVEIACRSLTLSRIANPQIHLRRNYLIFGLNFFLLSLPFRWRGGLRMLKMTVQFLFNAHLFPSQNSRNFQLDEKSVAGAGCIENERNWQSKEEEKKKQKKRRNRTSIYSCHRRFTMQFVFVRKEVEFSWDIIASVIVIGTR